MKLIKPYDFYPNQSLYIELVKETISQGKIVLIEAGTGFGKTIANLYGALTEEHFSDDKIIYVSRTNNQNSQVITELKNLVKINNNGISLTATQLASRKFLCHVEEVLQADNETATRMCAYYQKRNDTNCFPITESENYTELEIDNIRTIDDLNVLSKKHKCCAYLSAQEFAKESKIISGSYNYFLDPQIRKRLQLTEKPKVVIVDEAHNIEDLLCRLYSESLTSENISDAIKELRDFIKFKSRKLKDVLGKGSKSNYQITLKELLDQLRIFEKSLINTLNHSLKKMDQKIETLTLNSGQVLTFKFKEYAFFASQFRKFLLKNNMTKEFFKEIKENLSSLLEDIIAYYIEEKKVKKKLMLSKLAQFVSLVEYNFISSKFAYLVRQNENEKNVFKIEFQCLTPEIAFRSLKKSTKSIVLCSGTLNPAYLWKNILNIPDSVMNRSFPTIYNLNNVKVLALGSDKDGNLLTTKYKHRIETKNEVFRHYRSTILKIIFHANIPGGGILLFVPSYDIIEKINLPNSLNDQFGNKCNFFVEVRAQDPQAKNQENEEILKLDETNLSILDQYRLEIKSGKKSVLVGVLGGKFSEGTDFKDEYARLSIVVGLPYPTIDPLTKLKKIHYNVREKKLGETWYKAQAIRKVSQALGRVCRNNTDWGLGIILESRLLANSRTTFDKQSRELFSNWIKQVKEDCNNYIDLVSKMNLFYQKFKE